MNNYLRSADTKTLQDIQEKFESLRRILKAIFDSTSSSIFLLDADYAILFYNKQANEGIKLLHGREAQLGESILSYGDQNNTYQRDEFKCDFQRAILTKDTVVREREILHPNMRRWTRLEYTAVYEDQMLIGVLLNATNVSHEKEFERQNDQRLKQLDQIAWSQSHETRQPVATILGLINILDRDSLTTENMEIIKLLKETTEKLDEIIHRNVFMASSI